MAEEQSETRNRPAGLLHRPLPLGVAGKALGAIGGAGAVLIGALVALGVVMGVGSWGLGAFEAWSAERKARAQTEEAAQVKAIAAEAVKQLDERAKANQAASDLGR